MKISRCFIALLWVGIGCEPVEDLKSLSEPEVVTPNPEDQVQPQRPGQFVCAAEAPVAPTGFVLQPGVNCEAITDAAPGGRRRYKPSQPDMSCGDRASNYVEFAYNHDAYDLHVLAVYEPSQPGGTIEVQVQRSDRPIVLALTSYESVTWDLQVAADANLEAVLLSSYDPSQVVGTTAPIHLIDRSALCGSPTAWESERNEGGSDIAGLQAALRAITGLTERSFQGCYLAARFVVPFHETCATIKPAPTVNGDETVVPGKTTFTQCPILDNDAHVCMAAHGSSLELVGVESGATCALRTLPTPVSNDRGMWWHGEILYACTPQGLLRASLIDSSFEILDIDCRGIGEVSGEIWMIPAGIRRSFQAFKYADVDALYSATGEAVPSPMRGVSRYSIIADSIYGVWHSASELTQLDSNGTQRQHALGGHDGWVNAMSVTEDGLMIFQDHLFNVVSLQLGSQVLAPSNMPVATARACIQWR